MQHKIVRNFELINTVEQLPQTAPVALLFGGDRLSCCDEGVALYASEELVGLATLAPYGEDNSGTPTIVGVYVTRKHRGYGHSKFLLHLTLARCEERGFTKVQIDVLSAKLLKAIGSLPKEQLTLLEVHDHGGIMDEIPG